MKILAVDTSSNVASCAVCDDEKLICEFVLNNKLTHSQTLMPMIDRMLSQSEIDIKDIDLFATSIGPGSFTGLRIGIATVKGFCQALSKEAAPVGTLEAMAYNLVYCPYLICPIMDARREQVYNGLYRFSGEEFVTVAPQRALSVEELIKELSDIGEKVVFVGDAVKVYRAVLEEKLGGLCVFAPVSHREQRASAICEIARKMYADKKTVSGFELEPIYLRKPQAEREYEERMGI